MYLINSCSSTRTASQHEVSFEPGQLWVNPGIKCIKQRLLNMPTLPEMSKLGHTLCIEKEYSKITYLHTPSFSINSITPDTL